MDSLCSVTLPPRTNVPDERDWLSAARLGEPWALEQFFHSYHSQVYALCHRLLGRSEDAQDATQAAFVRAFRELPRFRGDSTVRTWLYRIALNEALGMRRRRRETLELAEENACAADGTPAVLERLAVRAALAQVSPAHRAILVLRFWEGLSYLEIAAVLDISLPAVKMRLQRAREEFRKRYEEQP
jgi:RNA polymerase sigma-70 factor (ECF subfamily)